MIFLRRVYWKVQVFVWWLLLCINGDERDFLYEVADDTYVKRGKRRPVMCANCRGRGTLSTGVFRPRIECLVCYGEGTWWLRDAVAADATRKSSEPFGSSCA